MEIPPPVIDSARLVVYAINDNEVEFTDKLGLYVGGVKQGLVRLGEMPKITICRPYSNPNEFLIFLSNNDWEPQGTLVGVSLDDAKSYVEKGYKGISSKWIESPYSQIEVEDYLIDVYGVNPKVEWWVEICAFCGRADDEVEWMIRRKRSSICDACIVEFYEVINTPDD